MQSEDVMMERRCFVSALAQVSCQQPLSDEWFDSPCRYEEGYARAQDPSVKGIISPMEARRMSKILKRAVCTAHAALETAGVEVPDAIITGSGMGCMDNTEKFLTDLSRYGESCLKPTLFMQSTHNTVSSLEAIMLKCHGYNNTYSHLGISFESALLDAWIQIGSGAVRNALVSAHDEVTPLISRVMRQTHPEYSFISECSMSALLTDGARGCVLCEVESVRLFNRPEPEEVAELLAHDHESVIMTGINGNPINDSYYEKVLGKLDHTPLLLGYRHLFGDNFSSSALGFYAACRILERGVVPQFMKLCMQNNKVEDLERITLLNHSEGSQWSVVKLKRCERCGS